MADASARRASRTKAKRRTVTGTSSQLPVSMKRLTLDLPEPLHRAIKRKAADDGVTMAEKLRALLSEHYPVDDETR
jgi:hypothetical protein